MSVLLPLMLIVPAAMAVLFETPLLDVLREAAHSRNDGS